MTTQQQITNHIATLPEAKGAEVQALHERILQALPGCKLWYDAGVNAEGKVVTNPTIGYGQQTITYADGKTKDFFRIGLSANKTGISVYILGIADKKYLTDTYGSTIGKATVTGYCIKFKKPADINIDILMAAVRDGAARDKA